MAVAWSTAYQCHHPETIYFTHQKTCFFRNYSVISGCIIFDLSQPLHISLPAPSLSQKRAIWLKRNGKTTAICPLWKILPAQYQCWLHDYESQEQTSFILRPALQKLKGWRYSCNILQVRGTQITLRKGFFFWSVGWSDRQVHPKGIQAIKGKNNFSGKYTPSLPHRQGTHTEHCQTLGPLGMSPSLINSAHTDTTVLTSISDPLRSIFCCAIHASPCLHSQGEKSARLILACITPRLRQLSGSLTPLMAWQCTKILHSPPERCSSLPTCKELHSTLTALSLCLHRH